MKIILRREDYDATGGAISESHDCIDCGFDTAPGVPDKAELQTMFAAGHRAIEVNNRNHEQYIVHDTIWRAAGMGPWSGCLCIGCLERRLGRPLTPDDFPADDDLNALRDCTKRLRERRERRSANEKDGDMRRT